MRANSMFEIFEEAKDKNLKIRRMGAMRVLNEKKCKVKKMRGYKMHGQKV